MRKLALVLVVLCLFAAAAGAATWQPRAPLYAPRCSSAYGVNHVNGAIYLTRGLHNDRYDIAGDSWSMATPNPRGDRTNLNTNAVIGSEIYFVGGSNLFTNADAGTVDKYNAATDAWTLNVANFIPNAHAGTIAHNNTIYSFGGTLGGAATLSFRFTPPSSTIFVLSSMPTGRQKPAIVAHGGSLWAIGGIAGSLTAVEVFNPLFGTWSAGPPLPVASPMRAAGVAGGEIHALLTSGLYRLSNGTWTQVAPPPPILSHDYAAIFAGDDVYAIGGCSLANYVLTVSAADITPPVLASVSASPNVLSVPNHKLVPVTVSVIVTDDTDPAPSVHIASVTSSEPDDALGDGDTPNDIVITGPATVQLRAERSGKGTGRTYTITVKAMDASGNSSTATTTVLVPRGK